MAFIEQNIPKESRYEYNADRSLLLLIYWFVAMVCSLFFLSTGTGPDTIIGGGVHINAGFPAAAFTFCIATALSLTMVAIFEFSIDMWKDWREASFIRNVLINNDGCLDQNLLVNNVRLLVDKSDWKISHAKQVYYIMKTNRFDTSKDFDVIADVVKQRLQARDAFYEKNIVRFFAVLMPVATVLSLVLLQPMAAVPLFGVAVPFAPLFAPVIAIVGVYLLGHLSSAVYDACDNYGLSVQLRSDYSSVKEGEAIEGDSPSKYNPLAPVEDPRTPEQRAADDEVRARIRARRQQAGNDSPPPVGETSFITPQ